MRQRRVHHRDSVRIFGADVDHAAIGADGESADRHALDDEERIALHQHAVRERAAVALVGVDHDVLALRLRLVNRAPLDGGGKTRAAAPAKP